MSNKKITPHQMRKGLTYVQEGAPDFMRMLTGRTADAAANDPRNPYRKPIGIEAKFQTENASDDDDEPAHDILNEREEERPTVVVLKDGKHLDERQVRNILKNLPPGLSEADIQRHLAEEMEKLNSHEGVGDNEDDEEEEEDDDHDPIDANGKILFRKPKSSSKKKNSSSSSASKKDSTATSIASLKNFEETLLGDAQARANALKRKSGAIASASSTESTPKSGVKPSSSTSKSISGAGKGSSEKKKKQKTAVSLLSFGDDE
ncbi:hypothetical protein BGZ98_002370 [Dissophora globulifera]|nr:hypothetical protein BGZ98_002370 [Dissophora globulifera]